MYSILIESMPNGWKADLTHNVAADDIPLRISLGKLTDSTSLSSPPLWHYYIDSFALKALNTERRKKDNQREGPVDETGTKFIEPDTIKG